MALKRRQTELLTRGMSHVDDLAGLPGLMKLAVDPSVSKDELLDALEAHVAHLEATLPSLN